MKLSDLKPGDTILCDSGFTCLRSGPHQVEEDDHGLYVRCNAGHHYLDGQQDASGNLVGIQPYLSSSHASPQIYIEVVQPVPGTPYIRRVRKLIDYILWKAAKYPGALSQSVIDECLSQINDQPPTK